MAIRIVSAEGNKIGGYMKLTNSYCLVPHRCTDDFYSTIESELADVIPVVKTSVCGTGVIGCFCAGNKNGIVLSHRTTDEELHHLRDSLPDEVVIKRLENPARTIIGNCISCNDYAALVHTGVDKETEELIEDVLAVEVFRSPIVRYCAFSNKGGLVSPDSSTEEDVYELSGLLPVPLVPGTVNRGCGLIAAGLLMNDWTAFCGSDTTAEEMDVIDGVLRQDVYHY